MNVEFVSANPTGPLHVGHGRQAAIGDAISALLECDRMEGVARVLLQRRRRADHRISRSSVQARVRELGGVDVAYSRGRLSRRVHYEISHSAYIDEHLVRTSERRRSRRVRRVRRARAAQGAGSRPAGVRRQVRRLLPRVVALRRRPMSTTTIQRLHRRAATRTRKTARSGSRRPTSATTRIA